MPDLASGRSVLASAIIERTPDDDAMLLKRWNGSRTEGIYLHCASGGLASTQSENWIDQMARQHTVPLS